MSSRDSYLLRTSKSIYLFYIIYRYEAALEMFSDFEDYYGCGHQCNVVDVLRVGRDSVKESMMLKDMYQWLMFAQQNR